MTAGRAKLIVGIDCKRLVTHKEIREDVPVDTDGTFLPLRQFVSHLVQQLMSHETLSNLRVYAII